MIGKLTRTIVRTFAFALAFCATSAWAVDADYVCVNFGYNSYSFVGTQSGEKGISPYAVVGTRWTDVDQSGFSGTTVKAYDVDGNESSDSITVSVSGGTGSPHYWNTHDYGLFSGYIDDSASALTPSASFSGVPFDYYRVIVYFSSDGTRPVGHITVNDVLNLKGSGNSTVIGTVDNSGWGSVPSETFTEGSNVLVSPVLAKTSDSTVKVLGHASHTGSGWNYRSCIAAIQIFKVADTPYTCTYTAPGTDTYNLFGAGNWDVEPASGSEAVTIAISGNTTLTVNDSRVFRSLTITGSGELTFAGTGTIITPSLTIDSGITLVKTAGNISSSATVSVPSGCTFEIASACTWSGVISGAGSVAVSGREVVFSAANTYTGNLTIKSGGAAKSANTSAFGPDWRSVERYVVVEDGGVADINGNGMVLAYKIAGDGAGSGALISTGGNIADGIMQTKKIILTADASIGGTADWGLLANSHYATEMTLGSYTLTKKGSANFWICNATISGTGSFVIEAGTAKTIYNVYKSTCNNGKIKVKDGGKLWIGTANLDAKSITCDVGGTVEVSSGRQLLIKNGGDMTVNGTATITGTLKLAEDETASSTGTLTVGGTVTVTGTVDIPHRANIVRIGTGKVDIKSGGKVHYNYVFKNVNSKDYGWMSDYEGDVFTGAGTLEIRTNRTSIHDATSSFSGIVKLYTASASNTGYINVLDGLTFTQRPEFITEGYYNLGNTATLAVRDLSGSGVFLSNYSPYNLKYIDTKQTKPTTFSGTFLNDGADSNTRDVGLTVRGSEDGVYALTLSGASTSRTALTIQDNGKVIFPSTGGSWSSGTVVVANGGYIEAQNTSALGTVDIQSGSVIVIPTVSDAPVALTCSTVTLPTSGTVTVDLSGVSVGEGESVPVISATSLVNAKASIFRQTEGGWRFSVDNNTIKATKLGTATWSDGTWSDSDLTGYASASITASGTQDVTLPATTSFDTLTITGSGTVTLTSTSSETCTVAALSIGAGVTLNASSSLVLAEGCAITGEGVLNIPANTTLAMDGVTCSTKVTVAGTLETRGTTTLSAANTSAAGSLIEVVSDVTTLSTKFEGISGDIKIDAPGELKFAASWTGGVNQMWDYLAPDGSTCIKVYGKLTLPNVNIWMWTNTSIELYDKAVIEGSGDNATTYGSLMFPYNSAVNVYGNATINAPINTRTGISPTFTIAEGKTLTLSNAFIAQTANPDYAYACGGSLTKAGAGTLQFTQETLTKPITINEGKVQLRRAFTSGLAISIASGAELELGVGHGDTDINATSISFAGVTGTGTIRFSSSHTGYYTLPSSAANMFATTLHVANDNTVDGLVIPWSGGVTTNRLLTAAGKYRTDWSGSSDVADRYFLALQDCDATWSGVFHQNDRLHGMKVAGVESAEHKTLTLSGTQSHTNTLEVVPSGSVNLTGSWIGDTTVNGEFGGTGSIDGALTLNAGSTFKVWATGGLTVTGSVTFPEDGISVDVSDLTIGREDSTVLLTATSGSNFPTVENFTLTGSSTHVLSRTGQKELSLLPIIATYSRNDGSGIVTPYADSVDIAISALVMQKATYPNAYVTVFIGAPSYYTAELLASNGIALDAETGNYVVAEAKIDDTLYPTIEAAIADAGENDTVELARNISKTEVAVNKEVEFSEGDYTFSGSFTGSGTIVLGAALKAPSADRWAAGWTGTVWLQNLSNVTIVPVNYGNADSVIKFTGVSGQIAAGTICSSAVELEDDGDTKALTLNSYSTTTVSTITFNEFRGSGTFATVGGTADAYPRTNFRILKWDDFVGSLDVDRGRAVFGTDTISNDDWRYIYISEDADVTIAAGKSFTANQGLRVYGELTVESNDALSSKAVQGSGTIIYEVAPNNGTTKPSFHATLWTGVVEFQEFAAAGIKLAEYGTSNSKIKINGITSGHLMWEDQNVQAEVVLAGDVNITATSHRNYTYAHISGTGSFSVSNSNASNADPYRLTITKLDVASGSVGMAVTNNTSTTLTINKLVLPAIPACDAKVLAVGGTGTISLDVSDIKFGVNEESLPAKYKLERRHVREEGDGFYVYYNGAIFSVY